MKQLIIVAALLLLPLAVGAATYSWTDVHGTMHFTDDIGTVPKKYRAKALLRADNDTPTAPVPTAPTTAGTKQESGAPPAVANGAVSPATRFGDRTAAQWQAEIRGLRTKLKGIEQQQEQLREEGGNGKILLTRQKIDEINSRSKQLYNEYEATRLRLNQLVEQANKVGLPSEYGQ